MELFNRITSFFLVITICIGILSAHYFPELSRYHIIILYLAILGSILLFYLIRKGNFSPKKEIIFIVLCSISLASIGMFQYFNKGFHTPTHYQSLNGNYVVVIQGDIRQYNNYFRLRAKTLYHNQDSLNDLSGQRIMLWIKNHQKEYSPGDTIYCTGYINAIKKTNIPEAFNFKRFYNNRGIKYQAFTDSIKSIHRSYNAKQFTKHSLAHYRYKLIRRINIDSNLSLDTKQLIIAMILGDRSVVDKSTINLFNNSGTLHVLAVSGLHVGIIYMVLLNLLNAIPFFKNRRIPTSILLVFLIWVYALLSGFSISVIRASVMFTFFSIGLISNKHTNPLNIVLFSAFIMLTISPHMLFEVGFWLSYMAVIGILVFYPIFSKITKTHHKFIDFFLDIFWAGVSAQLGTVPIIILVFGYYPTYSIFNGLFIIPMATLFIITGLVWNIANIIPMIGYYIAIPLNFISKSILYFLDTVNQLPYVLIKYLHITLVQSALLYITIIIIGSAIKLHHLKYYKIAFITLILFTILGIAKTLSLPSNEQYIFDYKKNTALLFRQNKNIYLAYTGNQEQLSQLFSQLYPYCCKNQSLAINIIPLNNTTNNEINSITIDSINYIIFNKSTYQMNTSQHFKTHVAIIGGKYYHNIEKIHKNYDPDLYIIEGGIHKNVIEAITNKIASLEKKHLIISDSCIYNLNLK
ncbi:ComEC family competence protein [Bacteroidales bacterium]|nr:ComEC family competence protein [Bacteroidales bacterium]